MTFVPLATSEITGIRKRRLLGWSINACASHYRRRPDEIETVLWLMLGRWKQNITNSRDLINRRLAMRDAAIAVADRLAA